MCRAMSFANTAKVEDGPVANEESFEPRLGRMRAKGGKRGRKYLHRVLAAANLARGGAFSAAARRGFSGSRMGRGGGVGRVLASRDAYAAYRARRVIINSRSVKISGKGAAGPPQPPRYTKRVGTTPAAPPGHV